MPTSKMMPLNPGSLQTSAALELTEGVTRENAPSHSSIPFDRRNNEVVGSF